MKSVDYLKLAAVLAVTAVASAPAFAASQTMPTNGQSITASGSQTLTPFPKKWWAED